MLRVVFGARDEREFAQLRAAVEDALAGVRSLPRVLAMVVVMKDLGPRSPWGRFRLAVERFDALLYELLARRRGRAEAGASVLSLLLAQRDEDGNPPTDQHLRDQLVALLMGGHDSSAASLAWAFERLARSPEVHARLREGDPAYLDAVVKEVLRVASRADDRAAAAARAGADRRADDPGGRPGRGLPVAGHAPGGPVAGRGRVPARALAGRRDRTVAVVDPLSAAACAGAPGAPFAEMEMREVLRAAAALDFRPARPRARAGAAQHARGRARPGRRGDRRGVG